MAAQGNPRLRITHAAPLGQGARLLRLERADGAPFGFAGGQYLIVNTGITLPSGKLVKRAYSLLSSDAEQGSVEIAVKRVGAGPGSNALNDLPAGAELEFSGPWGKLRLPQGFSGRALVVVTDTAITAGLGVAQSAAAQGAAQLDLLWLVESPAYFAPEPFVRERFPAAPSPAAARSLSIDAAFLPVAHPERADRAAALVGDHVAAGRYDLFLLAGDGAVIHPLRQRLTALGAPEDAVLLESFFNNPMKKSS